jgi:hypothetical protein
MGRFPAFYNRLEADHYKGEIGLSDRRIVQYFHSKECAMKNVSKKNWGLLMAGIVLAAGMLYTGCGTIFHTRSVEVKSLSGAAANIKVVEDGIPIYDGPLPASVTVKGAKKDYTIFYTNKDGNETSMTMTKKFNGWFVADILMFPPIGFIVDLVTGDIYTLNKTVLIPISYQETDEIPFAFVEGILAEHLEDLTVIGNIYSDVY